VNAAKATNAEQKWNEYYLKLNALF